MITNAELLNMMNRCSRCGACQAYCPLYLETRREPFVARGKVELLELLVEGRLSWNRKLADLFSTCLLCGNCGDNCPNGVKVDLLVREGRRDLVAKRGLPVIKRTVFEHLLKKDGRLSFMARLLYLYQRLGLQQVVRASGILQLLPGDLGAKERLLPGPPFHRLSSREFRRLVPAVNKVAAPVMRVGYFTGCMTNYIYPRTGFSLLKVLKAHNVEVIIPDQCCCGIPALAGGDYETARQLGQRNISAFQALGVDYIVTDCASCLGTWLEYPGLMEGDPPCEELVKKTVDISTLLVEILQVKLPPVNPRRITYHDPCHLKRVKGGKENPRILLKQVAGQNNFLEMKDADRCCGSAGSFNISHYQLSQQVVQSKVHAASKLEADYLATGCPACMMQLQHALAVANLPTKVVHTIELAAMAIKDR